MATMKRVSTFRRVLLFLSACVLGGVAFAQTDGSVQSLDQDGFLVTKSQIYTDYFVKGTQPTTVCPIHPGGILADNSLGVPVPVPTSGLTFPPPPPPNSVGGETGVNLVPPITGGTAKAPPPKRGFWGRIFGRGRGGGG